MGGHRGDLFFSTRCMTKVMQEYENHVESTSPRPLTFLAIKKYLHIPSRVTSDMALNGVEVLH
jgi:hypothetical protein